MDTHNRVTKFYHCIVNIPPALLPVFKQTLFCICREPSLGRFVILYTVGVLSRFKFILQVQCPQFCPPPLPPTTVYVINCRKFVQYVKKQALLCVLLMLIHNRAVAKKYACYFLKDAYQIKLICRLHDEFLLMPFLV